MIAFARSPRARRSTRPDWHAGFLKMLPAIRSQLRFAFRHLQPEERSEALAEATASIAIVYARLFQQGKIDVAYPSVLARFAAAQYGSGRIDFDCWLRRLSPKRRRIAANLGSGESTLRVAQKFRLSAGRISQLRREFQQDWRAFHGESADGPF